MDHPQNNPHHLLPLSLPLFLNLLHKQLVVIEFCFIDKTEIDKTNEFMSFIKQNYSPNFTI